MKRVRFLALLGVALACSKNAPSGPIIPPWQVLVTGVKPGGFALPPALVVCDANGTGCSPVKAGLKLGGNKLVRTERGVSEFELDSATHVEIAEGSELLLEDAGGRTLELRSGGMALSRSGPAPDAGPLLVRLVDRTLQLTGRSAIVAQLENANRGQLFVTRGTVKSVEPAGSLPPIRDYHPGEGATFERQGPADLHAVFSGAVSRFRQSVLALADTPPPPKTARPPRGLGTMTARVPGTTTVIEGVRLAQHRVRAVVRNGVAQTEVEEVFQNDTDRVLEGRYVFPLPPDATISGLTLFVGDKPVQGELVEKKRAAAIFKGIVEDTVRPRDPALLEWVTGSQFSLKVFPIPSRGSRKVVLRYQQVLTSDGPRQIYAYPLSFGAERRTPIDELSIDVELSDGGQAVQGVVASGYAATVQPAAESTRVTLRADEIAPERDFAVSFRRAAPSAIVARVEQGFVALRLRAELPSNLPVPAFRRQDRVVVVDASQSQSSESFAAARELALGVLRGLEPDERFALLLCDSACQALPPRGMAAASAGALDQARALLDARKPSGSSDLAGALLGAAERVPAGAAVQVVYVGDGAPSAGELSVPSIAGRLRSSFAERKVDLRLFGAGPSVDEVTLSGLARELGGSYDNVASAGPLEEQAALLVTGLRSPLLVAPVVEAPAGLTELEPRALPNLRLGEEFVVTGRLASAALDGSAPFDVTLKGELEGAPYALARAVSAKPGTDAPFAARLWAEARIRELQTSDAPDRAQQVIELSKRFRVMSRETSWLVLENEQMFAEFGIPRSKVAVEGPGAGPGSIEQRALQSQELSQLESGAPGGDADALGRAADKDASPRAESAPAPPAPAKPAPSPAPASPGRGGSLGDGSSGLGGSTKSSEAEGAGSGASSSIAGPRAAVAVGGVTQSGGAVANAARVAAGMRAGIRACYQRSLNQNPDVAGAARLQLRIGGAGEVTNATLTPSGNLPPDLIACITARARAAHFDSPEGGSAVLLIPLKLTSERDSSPPFPPGAIAPRPRPQPPADVAVSRPGDDAWLGQGQVALDKLQAELAATPSSRKRNEALVRGLLLRGRFAPALAAAEHFVELDPDLPAARELLAYAAVASGDRPRASAAVDAITETAPSELKAHARAARAFEALADEVRACAHWRSVFELAPAVDSALYEALRCRARVLGDRAAALRDAKALPRPGPLVARLLPLLESGAIPAFEKSSGSPGQFEAGLTCEPQAECPYVIVITPTGTVFSPWTPALGRSSPTSFAFSGLLTGVYRVLLVGGAPSAKGQVEVRALNARSTFAFGPGHAQAIAFTQVTLAPAGLGALGIGSLSRF